MIEPYRTPVGPCAQCDLLRERLAKFDSSVVHPHQGENILKHHCVMCGKPLYKTKYKTNAETVLENEFVTYAHEFLAAVVESVDNFFCDQAERIEVTSSGIFRKKSKTIIHNEGCPPFPHIHRYCYSCKGSWNERTAYQEKTLNNT